jgi:transcriptional regulator with GAF, ATPase, and Fis domain
VDSSRNNPLSIPFASQEEDAALRSILEGTATQTGEKFFTALVLSLADAMGTTGAWVTEYLAETQRLRAIAFRLNGEWHNDFEYDIRGTACEQVIKERRLIFYPHQALELFPDNTFQAVSYLGVPLLDVDGKILGHLAVLDTKPMPEKPGLLALFQIFAARATAELQRLRAESELRESQANLSLLIDSVMDAIVELDGDLTVKHINPAGMKLLQAKSAEKPHCDFKQFLETRSRGKLADLIRSLDRLPGDQRSLWIPGGLIVRDTAGQEVPTEATLSKFELDQQAYYTLILRSLTEKLAAERKILRLHRESEYLQEEIKTLSSGAEIIGQHQGLSRVVRQVGQVAGTDATVLITGETGTGKEVIARCIHAASSRKDRPLVRVNCASIPENLVESELFGHEKGAFTGAVARREGRFTLADGGTIFLDEIGELPLLLQSKLLRVLQEGEFEPVGSSQTHKVNVRVIAATNRVLEQEVQEGTFREDLFFRLNVFPIEVPPLRERLKDIPELAGFFLWKISREMGRSGLQLSEADLDLLGRYHWPGNVRELQNVIERAIITAKGTQPDIAEALPKADGSTEQSAATVVPASGRQILSDHQLQKLERGSFLAALEQTGWRVSGKHGAAALLGIHPSTMASRMKKLGIRRPGQF